MAKIALVTGAAKGIGWASAEVLADAGMTVYISVPSFDEQAANDAIKASGKDIRWIVYDGLDTDTYKDVFQSIESECGRLDVLVNNFGYTDPKKDLDIAHIDPDFFQNVVTVNTKAVLVSVQCAIPLMKDGGSIINISSVAASVPDMTEMGYGTAKSAICHMTKMMATQLASSRIRCNAILPGMTMTDSVKNALTEDYRKFYLRHVPLGRGSTPEEIASLVGYLASDGAAMVTGQLIEVSGGYGMATPLYADMMDMALSMAKKE